MPAETPNRRSVLRLAGGAAAGALALGAVAGCGAEDVVHEPDPLAAQEIAARADAQAATAAIAVAPQRHAALSAIAAERTQHAEALRAEINRVIGVYGDGTTPVHRTRTVEPAVEGAAAPDTSQQTAPTQPQTVDAVRLRLTGSRRAAADLALTQSGYRAALLASISAACAAQTAVLLA
ncbi:hypothetical protein D5S18_15115 [Nocardia panacis]|uniref:Uncharacterized protein n=1 Tax=Nocardia panacis TaxID=2340916 RepID=A0A3A4KMN3_9NOCA|nr:hypothetical protein D5S18_15115 [Nocardia panacis]